MLNRINIEMLESANERQLGVIKNIGLSIEKLESILNVITDSMTASGEVQGLHDVRPPVPRLGDLGFGEEPARHRHGEVRQVRRVHEHL